MSIKNHRYADGLLTIVQNEVIRVPAFRREKYHTENPRAEGFRELPDGFNVITYSVTVNIDGIRSMAMKAARSRGKRSNDGPLSVRVTQVRHEGGNHA